MPLEFRYIVVGGGTAGCWLAHRLAAQQTGPVMLVEAGRADASGRIRVPNFYPRLFGSRYDWNYSTEPQDGLGGRRIAWPRGKLLGGSGAINALIHVQAASGDFERWGWDWAKRLAGFQTLPASPVEQLHPWSEAFLEACTELDMARNDPLLRSLPNTCGPFALTHSRGRRVHTGDTIQAELAWPDTEGAEPAGTSYPTRLCVAFQQLEQAGGSDASSAPNDQGVPAGLSVLTDASVQNVLLEDGRARGVTGIDGRGHVFACRASDTVILCAGAIGSPQLLMQSGIGPSEQIHALGITPIIEVPAVGENLQDHAVLPLVFECRYAGGLPRRFHCSARDQYRRKGRGPLASNIAEAGAFSRGSVQTSGQIEAPEFQIHFTPTHYLKYPVSSSGDVHCSLAVTDLHPTSRGRLDWQVSTAGTLEPRISPNYLDTEADCQRLIEGLGWAREIASRSALSPVIQCELLPGAKRQARKPLQGALRTFLQSIYHPVGTCRMGLQTQELAGEEFVVDQQFRVQGVRGLRVVDASVFPDLPSCNTNATTILLAEYASRLLCGLSRWSIPQ